jgi:hypothetical protein
VRTVGRRQTVGRGELEEALVHEHGGVEHGAALMRSETRVGDPSQVRIQGVEQAVERPSVAIASPAQQYGDVAHGFDISRKSGAMVVPIRHTTDGYHPMRMEESMKRCGHLTGLLRHDTDALRLRSLATVLPHLRDRRRP